MFIWCLNSTWQNDKSRKRLIFSAFGISSIECIQINKIQEHRQYKWKRCIIPLHISLLAIMTDSWVKGVKWHIYVWKDWIIMDEIHKRRFRQPLENHREGRNERLVRRLTTQKQAVLLEITPHFFSLKSLFPSQLLLVLLPPFFFFFLLVFQSFVICTKGSVSLEMCLLIGLSEFQLIFLLMWTLVLNL